MNVLHCLLRRNVWIAMDRVFCFVCVDWMPPPITPCSSPLGRPTNLPLCVPRRTTFHKIPRNRRPTKPPHLIASHRIVSQYITQLPIYPAPPPLITLIETPHPLEAHVRTAREHTSAALGGVREKVQAGVEKWVGWERVVERECP